MTTASASATTDEPIGSVTVIPHIVAGERVGPTGRTGPVFNPATGRQSAEVALASAASCPSQSRQITDMPVLALSA